MIVNSKDEELSKGFDDIVPEVYDTGSYWNPDGGGRRFQKKSVRKLLKQQGGRKKKRTSRKKK